MPSIKTKSPAAGQGGDAPARSTGFATPPHSQGALPSRRHLASPITRTCLHVGSLDARTIPCQGPDREAGHAGASPAPAGEVLRLPGMVICERSFHGVVRQCFTIRPDLDAPGCCVVLVLAGDLLVEIGGRELRAETGSLVTLDHDLPSRLLVRDGRIATLHLARNVPCAQGVFHGQVFAPETAGLLFDLVGSLLKRGGGIDAPTASAVTRSISMLIGAFLAGDDIGGAIPRYASKFARALQYIDHNIGRLDLSAATIASEIGVSRSVLYRMFESAGGVARSIRRRRLLAFRDALAVAGDFRTIAEVARSIGFADPSHANRTFVQEFGLTPGMYRTSTELRPAVKTDDPQPGASQAYMPLGARPTFRDARA